MALLEGVDQQVGALEVGTQKVEGLFLAGRGFLQSLQLLEHIVIVLAFLQLWQVAVVKREGQLVVVPGDDKIGDDIAGARGVGLAGAGLGIEAAYAGDGGLELRLGERQGVHDPLVVMRCESVEGAVDDSGGVAGVVVLVLSAVKLEGETLLQVACSYPRRVQLLDDVQHLLHLIVRHLYALGEGEVVGNEVEASPHIACIVEAADNLLRNTVLLRSEGTHGQLAHEMVEVRVFGHKDLLVYIHILVAFLSFAIAIVIVVGVDTHHVEGCIRAGLGQGLHHVVGAGRDFKHRVLLNLLFESLFQFSHGHLYQLQQ